MIIVVPFAADSTLVSPLHPHILLPLPHLQYPLCYFPLRKRLIWLLNAYSHKRWWSTERRGFALIVTTSSVEGTNAHPNSSSLSPTTRLLNKTNPSPWNYNLTLWTYWTLLISVMHTLFVYWNHIATISFSSLLFLILWLNNKNLASSEFLSRRC